MIDFLNIFLVLCGFCLKWISANSNVCPVDDPKCVEDPHLIQTGSRLSKTHVDVVRTPPKPSESLKRIDSEDLFEACQAKPAPSAPIALIEEEEQTAPANADQTACNGTTLYDYSIQQVATTCCPVSAGQACSGCAKWANGQCAKKRGGFVERAIGSSTITQACIDVSKWLDAGGIPCSPDYNTANCSDYVLDSFSSNTACCVCGDATKGWGGTTIGAGFEYVLETVAVGESVFGYPSPQTASFYTVDAGCDLAKYGMHLDGQTGQLSGTVTAVEEISTECQIFAHEHGVAEPVSAPLTLEIGFLKYESDALICSSTSTTFAPRVQGNANKWSDFKITCVPDIPWLNDDIASTGGTISCQPKAGAASHAGGIHDVEDKWYGQVGGVCMVTANQNITIQQAGEADKEKTMPRSAKVL